MISNRRIYLNTGDFLSGDNDNHADLTFPLSNALINASDNQKISLALCQVQIPTSLTYIRSSGISYLLEFTSTEAVDATSPVTVNCKMLLAFSNTVIQPPFAISSTDEVLCAMPFHYSSNISAIVAVMNEMLQVRFGDAEPPPGALRFKISSFNILEAEGSGILKFENKYWNTDDDFNNEFKKDSQKVGRMLGINVENITSAQTWIGIGQSGVGSNRTPDLTYSIGKDGDGILLSTNQDLDSFSSSNNGNSTILSTIPIEMGVTNRYYEVTNETIPETPTDIVETYFNEYRNGFIYHKNNNVFESHKTISAKEINNLRLTLRDNDNNKLFCNTNIGYELEVIIFE